jgi:hypothetical protein
VNADEIPGLSDAIDYRDLVIADFVDENACLRERVASLEADVVSYRGLVSVLLDTVQAWRVDPASEHRREAQVIKELRSLLFAALERLSTEAR